MSKKEEIKESFSDFIDYIYDKGSSLEHKLVDEFWVTYRESNGSVDIENLFKYSSEEEAREDLINYEKVGFVKLYGYDTEETS